MTVTPTPGGTATVGAVRSVKEEEQKKKKITRTEFCKISAAKKQQDAYKENQYLFAFTTFI